MSGIVTFLSDYGLDDAFVGICHGVIARTAPGVRVIDVCHHISPQDVRHGAEVLAGAVPYLPVGVHLALVDPVVGAAAVRPVAIATADGSVLVGPDNGLLALATTALGGATAAYCITAAGLWLTDPSPVFRGRDVFAPVAARLAAGLDLAAVGEALEPGSLTRLDRTPCVVDDDHVHAEVATVDHFGNLGLNAGRTDLEAAGILLGDDLEVRLGGRTLRVPFRHTYGDVPVGRLTVCEDAQRRVGLAVNLGRAADRLRARRGDPVVLARLARVGPDPSAPYDPLAKANTR